MAIDLRIYIPEHALGNSCKSCYLVHVGIPFARNARQSLHNSLQIFKHGCHHTPMHTSLHIPSHPFHIFTCDIVHFDDRIS